MSAPPDGRTTNQPTKMSGPNHQEGVPQQQPSNVRVIPIVVEGRDEPVINRNVDHGTHFGESKPTHVPPQQPHIDREQYFADEGPIGYTQPPNFTRSFGAPFNKFRQGPQPFVQQKVYPQSAAAFARGGSPQRSQSPKPHNEEHYVKVPVHHEQSAPKPEPPSKQQQQRQPPQQQQRQPPQQQQRQPPQQQQRQPPQPQQRQPSPQQQPQPQKAQTPPPQPKPQTPVNNDPITQIISIQTDVLNLMTEVENFKGTKKDKEYLFLDEMLTRNLIKLDNIETDGKENIRQARKEAIKCIQKCIAVLEAKADNNSLKTPQPQEDETQESEQNAKENGEVEMEEAKEEAKVEPEPEQSQETQVEEQKTEEKKEQLPVDNKEAPPQAADTRPEDNAPEQKVEVPEQNLESKQGEETENKGPKKGTKNVKKRDKSKDKKEASKDKEDAQNTPKENVEVNQDKNTEPMQVDDKGDKSDSQTMEVDGPSQ